MHAVAHRLDRIDERVHRWLVAHSLTALRLSLGAIFLVFGFLKFFPGVSPADFLVQETVWKLSFGLVPGPVGLVLVALLETTIGVAFLTNRLMRLAVPLLLFAFVGILSPLVLFTGQLFSGPDGAPNLTGQYILKDVILLAGSLVVATTLRGGRLQAGRPAEPTAATSEALARAARLRESASAPAAARRAYADAA